jgi:CRP-like cAMP-binding protein
VIGYRALLAGETYRASAVALEDTVVGFVPKKTFYDILHSNPEMSMGMMKLLSQDLDQSETKRVDIATKTVRERLAEVLLLLNKTYGTLEDGKTLNINISREDLSGMVGTATEVLIRQLAKFKEEGLVETKGRRICILNTDALLKVSTLHE